MTHQHEIAAEQFPRADGQQYFIIDYAAPQRMRPSEPRTAIAPILNGEKLKILPQQNCL